MDGSLPDYKDWHKSQSFRNAIDSFALSCETPPEMSRAVIWNDKIMRELQLYLENRSIFITPEFVGSAYEGLKVKGGPVKGDDVEFDIMIVWDLKDPLVIEKTRLSNYVLIRFEEHEFQAPRCNHFDGDGYLLPALVVNDFFGKIQSCVNSMTFLEPNNLKIILRKHGPAIQMDVCRLENKNLLYSVDIVPSLKLANNEYYVAKELKYNVPDLVGPHEATLTWRRSYSLDEKNIFSNMENGNRKKLLKVLKMIRNKDTQLGLLTSYHLKNVLLTVCDKMPDSAFWSDEFLGERFIDLIRELISCLGMQYLSCYFQLDVNLFDGMKPVALSNLENRCKRMLNKESCTMNMLMQSPCHSFKMQTLLNDLPILS